MEVVAAYLLVRYPAVIPITAATIIAGVGNILITVAGQAYVASLGTHGSRANDFAVFGFASAFGHLIGPLLGGMISTNLGRSVAFGGLGVAGIAVALISLFLPSAETAPARAKPKADDPEGARELAKVARGLLRDPRAQMSIIISGCALGAFSINTSFYPVFLEGMGYSDGTIGALGSVRQLSALIVRPALGYLVGGFGARRTVQGVLLIGAIAIGVTPLVGALVPLALLAALGGTTTALTQPISMIMMAEGADDEHRGLAMGLRLTGNRLVQFVGPIILGVIVGYLGISWSFFGSAAVLVAGAAALYSRFSNYREVASVAQRGK